MKRAEYIPKISAYLSELSFRVDSNTSANLTDVNLHSENFYCRLLNLIYGYKLSNENELKLNTEAIDLTDTENSIAIQVTSTSALKKTKETVSKFISYQHHKTYERLVILNLVKKSKHRERYIGTDGIFQIDTVNDIWDPGTLVNKITTLDVPVIKEILDLLTIEFGEKQDTLNIPKEVNTIIALIDVLSNQANGDTGKGKSDNPDPNKKINRRFKDHAGSLKTRFVQLYAIYGPMLVQIEESTPTSTPEVLKRSLYLQKHSDQVLTNSNNNPKEALAKLTDEYCSLLYSKGIEYDETAIEFYLVTELTRCNVFPNET
ncbi:hypothetical protein SAMN04488540_108143 [Ferrimonas sediminum]|uniref:SMEK domain-containing protein n=1 Tax=Ferrimonas sediminum TaxID=718193 RepID=A0A1G8U0L1_9GAMM|nr:SMEK domain-containing protein [Ferrimonas sediminum]SDJ47283.1 hypothetical protein SAMN04488540_108143 [Ferrimonas sediminum]